PTPVVDEVGCKQIVVSEDDIDRTHGGFEPCGAREEVGKLRHVAAASFAQRVTIVTHHMEHPEHRGRPAQISRNIPMTPPDHVDEALQISRTAHVLRREGAALDEVEHENARLGVYDAGT